MLGAFEGSKMEDSSASIMGGVYIGILTEKFL